MSTTSSSTAAAEGHRTGQPVPTPSTARNPAQHQLGNMTRITGGRFSMGSARLPEKHPVHCASLDSQRRELTGEIGCRRACRQTLLPRWSAAPNARKLTSGRQWVEDVAGRGSRAATSGRGGAAAR